MRGLRVGLICALVSGALLAAGIGASSASALTKLCEVSTTPCPAASTYPAGSHFSVGGEVTFGGVTSCAFTYKFETGSVSGSPLVTKITSFALSSCTASHSVTALHLNWMFPISVSGTGPNGLGEMHTGSGGAPEIEIGGGVFIGCIYKAASIPQEIMGGGAITLSGWTLTKIAGSGCPTSTNLSMVGKASPTFYVTN
jgi:hypothetical protein